MIKGLTQFTESREEAQDSESEFQPCLFLFCLGLSLSFLQEMIIIYFDPWIYGFLEGPWKTFIGFLTILSNDLEKNILLPSGFCFLTADSMPNMGLELTQDLS